MTYQKIRFVPSLIDLLNALAFLFEGSFLERCPFQRLPPLLRKGALKLLLAGCRKKEERLWSGFYIAVCTMRSLLELRHRELNGGFP